MVIKDSRKVFDETFETLKRKRNKTTEQEMRDMNRELYPEDYD